MEENKKGTNQERVKIYDKDMYISQEKLRTIILIILVFVIGFVAGYFSKDVIDENKYNSNEINFSIDARRRTK